VTFQASLLHDQRREGKGGHTRGKGDIALFGLFAGV
jgi:hypothetical protein